MAKNNELKTILVNVKKNLILFIFFNILIVISFFYFYENTKTIKNDHISIKLVTDDFPTVTNMLENFKFYIEFVTNYELDVSNKRFTSSQNNNIDKIEITNLLDSYMDNYHNSIVQLKNSIKDNKLEAQTINSIDFYFQKINLFDRVYKLGDTHSKYKYNAINYLTLIFSLFLFLNFFLYVLILIIEYLKKNK